MLQPWGSYQEELEFATVQVPSVLDRIVQLPTEGKAKKVIFLEEIIERNMHKLFLNYDFLSLASHSTLWSKRIQDSSLLV